MRSLVADEGKISVGERLFDVFGKRGGVWGFRVYVIKAVSCCVQHDDTGDEAGSSFCFEKK